MSLTPEDNVHISGIDGHSYWVNIKSLEKYTRSHHETQ
jgi:hypothetical protein